MRRWRSKYLYGIGELLRASLGRPYFFRLFRDLPELRLWAGIYAWWAVSLGILVVLPDKALALGVVVALFAAVVALMSVKKGGLSMGLYTVVAWFFHAAALPFGFFARRREPSAPIESRIVGGNA